MDYQVFLVSRMHEEWVHTDDNRRAITVGQAETGGIITAAAIIMIAVFGGFVLGDNRVVKLFGLGLGERDLHRRVHPAHRARARRSCTCSAGRTGTSLPGFLASHRESRSSRPTISCCPRQSRANARSDWPRFRASPLSGQAMAADDPATVSWASSVIDRLITAKATGPKLVVLHGRPQKTN